MAKYWPLFDLGGEYVEGGSPCFQICLKFLKFKRLSKLSGARLKRVSETPQKSLDYGWNRQRAEVAKQIWLWFKCSPLPIASHACLPSTCVFDGYKPGMHASVDLRWGRCLSPQ